MLVIHNTRPIKEYWWSTHSDIYFVHVRLEMKYKYIRFDTRLVIDTGTPVAHSYIYTFVVHIYFSRARPHAPWQMIAQGAALQALEKPVILGYNAKLARRVAEFRRTHRGVSRARTTKSAET